MGFIAEFLKEFSVSGILRERLLKLDAEIDRISKENIELKKENAECAKKLREVSEKYKELVETCEDFKEYKGALFKRRPEGGYHEAVYCPRCKIAMSAKALGSPFRCFCGFTTHFNKIALNAILKELTDN